MLPGAVADGLGKACNPAPDRPNAVAALDIDWSAIFMDLSLCDRSLEAQILAAGGTHYRSNRRTAH
jgi:hypothetical protein